MLIKVFLIKQCIIHPNQSTTLMQLVVNWLAVFNRILFLLERTINKLQELNIWQVFFLSKMNKVNILLQEKQLTISVTNGKVWTLKPKLEFRTLCLSCKLHSFPIVIDISEEMMVILINMILMLYDEMYQQLEHLNKSVN